MEPRGPVDYVVVMDTETRAAFARIDNYFELNQAQIQDLREDLRHEIRHEVGSLRTEMREDISGLRAEFRSFRDWVTTQLADVRVAIQQLTTRIDRFDRPNDPIR